MNVKEIESKISEIDGKISGLRSQKTDLMAQLRDALNKPSLRRSTALSQATK